MKRSAIIILIAVIGILMSGFTRPVNAQGTCTCKIGINRACGLDINSCASGYQPQCADYMSCTGIPTSCTCVASTPQNCLPVGSQCSYPNIKPCCAPYSCFRGYCAPPSPIIPTTTTPPNQSTCQYIADTTQKQDCDDCANGTGKYRGQSSGVWTAVGCITTDPNNLLGTILRLGLGLAGGIAFLLILFGGLQIMTSAGNPEHLNAGRELISSAIIGLILILFSIFLLQFIGVNIIGIPGFVSK